MLKSMSTAASSTLTKVLSDRRSIRAFKPDAIPLSTVRAILNDAKHSPSWCNVQPYAIYYAHGDKLVRIRRKLTLKYDEAIAAKNGSYYDKLVWLLKGGYPDGDFDIQMKYPSHLQALRVACAKGLYSLLGIERKDLAAREANDRKNFEMFDAPSAFFIFVEGSLMPYSAVDAGCFIQSLVLSAHARGLGSCVQGSLATWGSPVREEFADTDIPESYKLLCGISLGVPAENAKVNTYNPGRADLVGGGWEVEVQAADIRVK
jgi:nitroreductase